MAIELCDKLAKEFHKELCNNPKFLNNFIIAKNRQKFEKYINSIDNIELLTYYDDYGIITRTINDIIKENPEIVKNYLKDTKNDKYFIWFFNLSPSEKQFNIKNELGIFLQYYFDHFNCKDNNRDNLRINEIIYNNYYKQYSLPFLYLLHIDIKNLKEELMGIKGEITKIKSRYILIISIEIIQLLIFMLVICNLIYKN